MAERKVVEKLLTDSGIKTETATKVVGEVIEMVKDQFKEELTAEIKAELGIPEGKTKGKREVRIINNFDDWNKDEVYKTTFLRPGGAVVFECRPLSHGMTEDINKQCDVKAPKKEQRNPINNQLIKDNKGIVQWEDDVNDPEYIKKKQDMTRKEKLLVLEKSMPQIKIPGKDWQERWVNLGKKIPAGDIERLYNYIIFELTGYSGLVNPFVTT